MNQTQTRGFPNTSALAWELANQIRHLDSPVVLVPTHEQAIDLQQELYLLADFSSIEVLAPLETNLLKHRGPSTFNRNQRSLFLSKISALDQQKTLFILSVDGLIQKSAPLEFFKTNRFEIAQGSSLTRENLVEKLASIGYLPTDLVERPGQFAARGSIVDLFALGGESPVRVELFDDQVQILREFNPDSQRMIGEISRLLVFPVRDFISNAIKLRPEIITEIKSEIYQSNLPGEDREFLVERFREMHGFPTLDYWGPGFLSKDVLVPRELISKISAVIDPFSILDRVQSSHREFSADLIAGAKDHHWVPRPEKFLNDSASLREEIQRCLEISPLLLSLSGGSLPSKNPEKQNELPSYSGVVDLENSLAQLRTDFSDDLLAPFRKFFSEKSAAGYKVILLGSSATQLERIRFLLEAHELHGITIANLQDLKEREASLFFVLGSIENGFIDHGRRICLVPEYQLFGTKKRLSSKKASHSISHLPELDFEDLRSGDFVVHRQHGIAKYHGLKLMVFSGVPSELLELEYRDGAKLFVPVNRCSEVKKFGTESTNVQLDKLGGQTWEQKKAKTKKDLESIAGDLIKLYSIRDLARGPEIKLNPEKIESFAASFPYDETVDQESAIKAIFDDLRNTKPMDRLICGDVGYGKTEVALRATHAVLASGFQVAVLAPTTLLATQHENNFRRRLEPFGFRVVGVSRLKSKQSSADAIKEFSTGAAHVIIGTHRLLSRDFADKKLGLLVVDEEQKFGVVHKERLKQLRNNVHVLTLTATPIPRTLNMAIAGIKDLSIITTPPQDRLSVKTHVVKKSYELIKQAVEEEVARGGQVFYVHNRVQSIELELEEMQKLLPSVSIEVVHGQMDEEQLEQRMLRFYEGKTQVLLATSIIESGLDIPNANTLIVDRADRFGLSQLYQIRGRVGRSNVRAFAYFLLPERAEMTKDAEKRLEVLEAYQELGSGFQIASHDLEIRGTGDFLGRDQSGYINAIGIETYLELLRESVAELRGEHLEENIDPDIQLPIDTTIPPTYIPETTLRLGFYRKLSSCLSELEIDAVLDEMVDRFGTPPNSVNSLGSLIRIKCQLRRLRIRSANAGKQGVSLSFDSSTPIATDKLITAITRYPAHFQLNPDGRLLIKNPALADTNPDILRRVEGALTLLENWVH